MNQLILVKTMAKKAHGGGGGARKSRHGAMRCAQGGPDPSVVEGPEIPEKGPAGYKNKRHFAHENIALAYLAILGLVNFESY